METIEMKSPLTYHSPIVLFPSVAGDGEPGGLGLPVALRPRFPQEAAASVFVEEGLNASAGTAPPPRGSVQSTN